MEAPTNSGSEGSKNTIRAINEQGKYQDYQVAYNRLPWPSYTILILEWDINVLDAVITLLTLHFVALDWFSCYWVVRKGIAVAWNINQFVFEEFEFGIWHVYWILFFIVAVYVNFININAKLILADIWLKQILKYVFVSFSDNPTKSVNNGQYFICSKFCCVGRMTVVYHDASFKARRSYPSNFKSVLYSN